MSEVIAENDMQFDEIEVKKETYELWLESLVISGRDKSKY